MPVGRSSLRVGHCSKVRPLSSPSVPLPSPQYPVPLPVRSLLSLHVYKPRSFASSRSSQDPTSGASGSRRTCAASPEAHSISRFFYLDHPPRPFPPPFLLHLLLSSSIVHLLIDPIPACRDSQSSCFGSRIVRDRWVNCRHQLDLS